MAFKVKKPHNSFKKDLLFTEIRKKLGITQVQLAAMLKVSRAYVSLVELKKRQGHSTPNTTLTNIFLQFHDLETGKLAAYRSLETKLFLNEEYKKMLPAMKALEQGCRLKIKRLKQCLEQMKEAARDAEHAIIVFTTAITELEERDRPAAKKDHELIGLQLFKQQAYEKLLMCWEPEQAKLHAKIEAIAGEAKALRRYRIKVTREHNPFKKTKKEKSPPGPKK